MAPRKKAPPPAPEPQPTAFRPPGMPVRLMPHDWPFLYSVLANGDLVMNQRLPRPARPKQVRKTADGDSDEALM